MKAKELEKLFQNVIDEFNKISRFHKLTSYTYDLALASVKNQEVEEKDNHIVILDAEVSEWHKDGDYYEVKHKSNESMQNLSYSPADYKADKPHLIKGWISFEEYAERMEVSIDTIEQMCLSGKLGEVKEKKGIKVLLWPPQECSSDTEDFSVDDENIYKAGITLNASVLYNKDVTYQEILEYLGSADNLQQKTSDATLLLNRETFLLYWSSFEQYIKNFTYALFELFPEQVIRNKKYGKNQMSYFEIFEKSAKFTDIQDLKDSIINSIIGDPVNEREAISRQISFIKDCYLNRDEDPYDTWYVWNGDLKRVNYQVLDQIRIIRNALVHKTGEMGKEWEKIDIIGKTENNQVVIDGSLLLKTELILKSICHNLYILITQS